MLNISYKHLSIRDLYINAVSVIYNLINSSFLLIDMYILEVHLYHLLYHQLYF